MSGQSYLSVKNLTAGYVSGMPILHGVDVTVAEHSLSLIIGPNGAGKSTLIKAIAGLVPVFDGTVTMAGKDITHMEAHTMARHGLAYVPQSDNIFRQLTVRENLMVALRPWAGDKATRLGALYQQFPLLAERQGQKAGAFSGGQRQLLAMAMALATEPQTMLLDEPSAGLSPKATEEILTLVKEITRTGVTILLVEQNVKQALAVADHCYILAEGKNQANGIAESLRDNALVGDIYLGGKRVDAS